MQYMWNRWWTLPARRVSNVRLPHVPLGWMKVKSKIAAWRGSAVIDVTRWKARTVGQVDHPPPVCWLARLLFPPTCLVSTYTSLSCMLRPTQPTDSTFFDLTIVNRRRRLALLWQWSRTPHLRFNATNCYYIH